MSSINNCESSQLVSPKVWGGIVERYVRVPDFNGNEPIYATQYQPVVPSYDAYVGFLELCNICDIEFKEDLYSQDPLYIEADALWSIANQEYMKNSSNRVIHRFPKEISCEDIIALEEFFTLCRVQVFVKQSK